MDTNLIEETPVPLGEGTDSEAEGAEETTPAENVVETPPETTEAAPTETKLEDLPESWQKEIRDLRRENAARRTSANASTEDLQAQIAAVQIELDEERTLRTNAEKKAILSERGLDVDKYLPVLVGNSSEDWAGVADSLVELRDSSGPSKVSDPVQVAASTGKNTLSEREKAANAFFHGLDK